MSGLWVKSLAQYSHLGVHVCNVLFDKVYVVNRKVLGKSLSS